MKLPPLAAVTILLIQQSNGSSFLSSPGLRGDPLRAQDRAENNNHHDDESYLLERSVESDTNGRNGNKRELALIGVSLCPGFEDLKVTGYSDLEVLRNDFEAYYATIAASNLNDTEHNYHTHRALRRPSPPGDGKGGNNKFPAPYLKQGEPIIFDICPKTTFQFDNRQTASSPPLVLLSPLPNPIMINCRNGGMGDVGNSCVFAGGDTHFIISYNTNNQRAIAQNEKSYQDFSILISGVTFRLAKKASVLMDGPRGKLTFQDCKWEMNREIALMIDGKSSSINSTWVPEAVQQVPPTVPDIDTGIVEEIFSSTVPILHSGPEVTKPTEPSDWMHPDSGKLFKSTASTPVTTTNTAHFRELTENQIEPNKSFSLETLPTEKISGILTPPLMEENEVIYFASPSPIIATNPPPLPPPMIECFQPLAIVLKSCLFIGNEGAASIMISSDSNIVGAGHSIHVTLESVTFSSENVEKAVIVNDGGNLQSIRCQFFHNVAESMINSTSGTISVLENQFTDNKSTGGLGTIIMDADSTLERNKGNCGNNSDGSSFCSGFLFDGNCDPFDAHCYIPTISDVLPTPNSLSQEPPKCLTTWDGLVKAVRNGSTNEHDLVICPGAILNVSSSIELSPLIIDSNFVSIKCGSSGHSSDNCVVLGGFSHFHLLGSVKGAEISGLTMKASAGSSIIAAGPKSATLRLNDCKWTSNTGVSAIQIHNSVMDSSGVDMLDTMPILDSSNDAMKVVATNCVFEKNELRIGTVNNIGGTLIVYKSLFFENSAMGGDIVMRHEASCEVRESCFHGHISSIARGTIFLDESSSIVISKNHGFNNTVRGNCNGVFKESHGSNCLTNSKCDGICTEFLGTSCPSRDYQGEIPLASKEPPSIDAIAPGFTSQTLLPRQSGGGRGTTARRRRRKHGNK